MLRTLAIRNFVIIERAELELQPGFCVFTGETGAGKSMLVDAIELLVGGRAEGEVVRKGADRAELAAEFDCDPSGALHAWLLGHDIDVAHGTLLIRRVIDRGGRSRCYLNGSPVTVAQLRQAGEWLIDIHGQHAHQTLLRGAAQRALLDLHAGASELERACVQAYRQWRQLESLVAQAEEGHARIEREREELSTQLADIERLGLSERDWEALNAEHVRLMHGASLLEEAQAAADVLIEQEGACAAQLGGVAARLRSLAVHDAQLEPIADLVGSAQSQAAEAGRTLRQYAARIDLDPAAVRETESRIEAIHAVARRYRVRPETLVGLGEETRARLLQLERSADIDALRRELSAARANYDAVAAELSARRADAAQSLSDAVTAQMQGLAMAGGQFRVVLRALERPSASGAEDVEFEVAAHPGTEPRALARVASGGELSRIGLAVQMITSRASGVPTLVFDEVDAGIGGGVADVVGRSLASVGAARQVLCVTHLPQVAARAAHQYHVAKSMAKGEVRVAVAALDHGRRVEELARMLGGARITATTRRHAEELLGAA